MPEDMKDDEFAGGADILKFSVTILMHSNVSEAF